MVWTDVYEKATLLLLFSFSYLYKAYRTSFLQVCNFKSISREMLFWFVVLSRLNFAFPSWNLQLALYGIIADSTILSFTFEHFLSLVCERKITTLALSLPYKRSLPCPKIFPFYPHIKIIKKRHFCRGNYPPLTFYSTPRS